MLVQARRTSHTRRPSRAGRRAPGRRVHVAGYVELVQAQTAPRRTRACPHQPSTSTVVGRSPAPKPWSCETSPWEWSIALRQGATARRSGLKPGRGGMLALALDPATRRLWNPGTLCCRVGSGRGRHVDAPLVARVAGRPFREPDLATGSARSALGDFGWSASHHARVLAEIRTRGFYSEVATTLLSGQSWRDLARWWRVSNLALAFEPSVMRKLQWAILRAAILDEMEAEDPERFSGWLGRQRPGRRYRSCR